MVTESSTKKGICEDPKPKLSCPYLSTGFNDALQYRSPELTVEDLNQNREERVYFHLTMMYGIIDFY